MEISQNFVAFSEYMNFNNILAYLHTILIQNPKLIIIKYQVKYMNIEWVHTVALK